MHYQVHWPVLGRRQYMAPLYTFGFITNPANVNVFNAELTRLHADMNSVLKYPNLYGVILDAPTLQQLFFIVNTRPLPARGGDQVTVHRQWQVVACELVLGPQPGPEFHNRLKMAYINYLAHFESVYYHHALSYSYKEPGSYGKWKTLPFSVFQFGENRPPDEEEAGHGHQGEEEAVHGHHDEEAVHHDGQEAGHGHQGEEEAVHGHHDEEAVHHDGHHDGHQDGHQAGQHAHGAILAPLELELKLARQEIANLQDDDKALDRLTKSKEAALLEAGRTVQNALAKASMVDDWRNKKLELMKQIEICQEENKILDKMHRQKVADVEKLTQTVRELEEAVLAGGATANAVRDYQMKVQEMNEERKILDRELADAKVTANRVATVVANMPVKQWLEERRFLQGEMQQLRDKLAIAEQTAKYEAQLKERYQLCLKVLEESLRGASTGNRTTPEGRSVSNGRRQSIGGSDNSIKANGGLPKKAPSFQSRSSLTSGTSMMLRHAKGVSKSFDSGARSFDKGKSLLHGISPSYDLSRSSQGPKDDETQNTCEDTSEEKPSEFRPVDAVDSIPGVLYDFLQKEVIALRKAGHEKDQSPKDKDDAIEMLPKKVETLTKAMEVEAKRMRREVAAMEKEVSAMRLEKEQENRAKRFANIAANSKSSVSSSQLLPGRNDVSCA